MAAEASLIVGDLDVSKLSDEELFQHLSALGETVGPIIGTTRKIYERKLACRLGSNISNASFVYAADSQSDEELEEQDVAPSQAYIERLSSGPARKRKPIFTSRSEDVYDDEDESEYLMQQDRSSVYSPSPRRPLRSADSSRSSERMLGESFMFTDHNNSIPSVEEQAATDSSSSVDIASLLIKAVLVTIICVVIYFVFFNRNSSDEFSQLEHLAKSASEALNAAKKSSAKQK